MCKKRVLHVVNNMDYGGVQSVIMNYNRELKEEFYFDFIIQRENFGRFEEEIKSLGGRIYRITDLNTSKLKFMLELCKILKNNQYDIIHMHQNFASIYPLLISKFLNVRVRVCHSHATYIERNFIKKFIKKIISGNIKLFSTDLVACSEEASIWLFGKNNNSVILKNGINIEKFKFDIEKRLVKRKELGLQEKIVLTNIANFGEVKNHRFLIQIFNYLIQNNKNLHLLLVGDGELLEEIKSLVFKLNLANVTEFMGKRKDIDEILQASDIFILPSIKEGLPVSLIEAQCSGLNCIVSTGIPKEAKIIKNVEFLDVNDSIEVWAEKILASMNYNRTDMSKEIIRHGYDIKLSSLALKKIYSGGNYEGKINNT